MALHRDPPAALCMIEPAALIGVVADSIGRRGRRSLIERVVVAWVDAIPEPELSLHYERALAGLDPAELRELASDAAGTPRAATPVARASLIGAFAGLGAARREALARAACSRAVAAFEAGVGDSQVIATVLPCLPPERLEQLARECTDLYLADRLGSAN